MATVSEAVLQYSSAHTLRRICFPTLSVVHHSYVCVICWTLNFGPKMGNSKTTRPLSLSFDVTGRNCPDPPCRPVVNAFSSTLPYQRPTTQETKLPNGGFHHSQASGVLEEQIQTVTYPLNPPIFMLTRTLPTPKIYYPGPSSEKLSNRSKKNTFRASRSFVGPFQPDPFPLTDRTPTPPISETDMTCQKAVKGLKGVTTLSLTTNGGNARARPFVTNM